MGKEVDAIRELFMKPIAYAFNNDSVLLIF